MLLRDFNITVSDADGRIVALTAFGKSEESKSFLGVVGDGLSGGERKKFDVELDKLFQMTAPGKYTVVVKRWVPKADRSGSVEVISNTLEFEVRTARTEPPGKQDQGQ